MSTFDIIATYHEGLLRGLGVTLKLSALIWCSGLIVGSSLGVAASRWPRLVGLPERFVTFFLSGVPVIVFLFWMHYPVQVMLHRVIDPFYTAAFTLSAINIFLVAEIVRGVLVDFPTQYVLAARVCGLSQGPIFWYIQLPIVLRQILPSLVSLQVSMLQMSLFASLIGVNEIFRVAQQINANVYKPVEIYTALGIFFLAICLPLNAFSLWLRKRFTLDISDR